MTIRSFFLSFDTNSFSSTACGFGVLTSNFKPPFMSKTTIGSHLEKSFNIFSQFGFQDVGSHLKVLSFFIIANSVQEPSRDTLSFRVINKIGDLIALLLIKFSSSDSRVDSEDLADEESKSSTNTFNLFKSIRDCPLAVDVGVEDTMDVLKIGIRIFNNQ